MSASWLAQKVSSRAIRWVLGEQSDTQDAGAGLPGDTRAGSKAAMTAVAETCRKVTLSTTTATSASNATSTVTAGGATGPGSSASGTGSTGSSSTLYDCQGRAAALQSAGS